jgi:mono/diheme cytochrome c family protein
MGDPLKVNCQTCHQGYSKPLGGVSMLADNPSLREIWRADGAVAAPAPAALVAAGAMRTTNGVAAGVAVISGTAAEAVAAKAETIRTAVAPTAG